MFIWQEKIAIDTFRLKEEHELHESAGYKRQEKNNATGPKKKKVLRKRLGGK